MNPSALFIRRPIATTLLTIGIALIGIAAFFVLPVAPLPQVDFPTIQVQARLPGASPEVMATSVATPLERTIGTIADITEMTSQSSNRSGTGSTRVVIQFGLDRDINGAARDVQAAINAAEALLPANLPSSPTYNKANPAQRPIMVMALSSDTLAAYQVYDAASIVIQQALSQISGVGEVDVFGGDSPAVRVEMNPYALNKYGIGLEDVKAALQSTNAFSPKGSYSDGQRRFQIDTNDQATVAKDYDNVIIAYRNNRPVRLSDISEVVDGPATLQNLGLANGKSAIIVQVTQSPGANIIATVDRINKILPQLRTDIAQRGPIDLAVQVDATKTIRSSLTEVERTLMISILLVVVVVLVFLRNGRATLIPAVAVTVSLLGTLGVMFLLHYSLDNLSLMALTVATGFVVDDAIVVLENITRHVENGMPRFQAALVGAGEVGFTVMSISISLIAVFIPILAMGGIVGRLFREFAVTLSAAIVISLIVSLTTTPMMAARLIAEHPGEGAKARRRSLWQKFWGGAADGFEWGFNKVHKGYEMSLGWALDNSFIVLMMLIATVILTGYLYVIVPKGFFPQQDTGTLTGGVQVDQASSFNLTANKFRRLQAIVIHDPAVQSVTSYVQSAGGFMFISLKPREQRKGVTADMVIQRLRPRTSHVSGANLFLQSAQDIQIGGRQSNAAYQYTLQSDNSDALKEWSDKLLRALQGYPDLTDVNTDQQSHALESYITYDRDTASRLGLTSQQIDNTLNDAFGQAYASIIYNPLNQYHVVMEVAQRYQQDPEALKDIYVAPPAGGATPAAATTSTSTGGGGASGASVATLTSTAPTTTISAATGSAGGTSASIGTTGATSPTAQVYGASTSGGSSSLLSSAAGAGGGASASTAATTTAAAVNTLSASNLAGAGVPRTNTGGAVQASTGVAVSTAQETMTPLSAIAHWALGNTPLAVNHQSGAVAATLSFNLAPGKSLSDAQRDVQDAVQKIGMPSTVVGSFRGTAQAFQDSVANEPVLILTALVAVYIVMGILYESYIHPLTVLSTLPSAGVGAVLALLIFHIDFSIIALIGVILLIGIVKKNAIMIIDFALVAEREQGLSSRDAIYQACMLRFRPILMTTCAAIMGAVPLAMGLGE
ncbi:MAG: efflux RND transporter permease subunit, partial [Caulobacteraceae bacterium]